MDKIMKFLSEKIPSANDKLQNQVLNDVVLRLQKKLDCTDSDNCKVNNAIVSNIKSLVKSLGKFGRTDREQIRFKENIALAASGHISYAKLMEATGLSRKSATTGTTENKLRQFLLRGFGDAGVADSPETAFSRDNYGYRGATARK